MTLKVAIAGLGYFSRFHQDAWSRCPEVSVVAIADRDAGKREAAAQLFPQALAFDDAEAMLDAAGPDCIDIVTPPPTHRALVRAAARRGIVAICQKPLAPSFEEAAAIVAEAETLGAKLIVHENFRFMPWFAEAKRLVDAGLVGTPLNVTFRLRPGDGQGPDAYLARQPYFQTMPRFLIHETGIHLVDTFRFLMGEITGVFARLKRRNPVIAGEDAGIVAFDFASGANGLFDGDRLIDHPARNPRLTLGVMVLEGDAGSIRLDGDGRLFTRAHGGGEVEHPYAWDDRNFGGDCVYSQTRHIVDHLVSGAPLVNNGRAYLRNVEIEDAIYRSHAEGRFIAV